MIHFRLTRLILRKHIPKILFTLEYLPKFSLSTNRLNKFIWILPLSFIEKAPIYDYDEMDRRLKNTDIAVAIEIPPNFAKDLAKGHTVTIAAWVDGAMPQRAETIRGYIQGIHQDWLLKQAKYKYGTEFSLPFDLELRYRYNPSVQSLVAIAPAVIPILLLLIPAMLTALSVVREKELGSIINLYVTPVSKLEFLLGKQIPYLIISMINFALLILVALFIFQVPIKGSLFALTVITLLFCGFSTGFGLLASTFTKSQIAAMFFTIVGTLIPAIQFAGLLNPVSSLEGTGKIIGELYPASHILTATRGVFNKALGFNDLSSEFFVLLITAPIVTLLSVFLLKKQER